jgi:MoaA/NifB/PqqE/SkfB family radical SAM enzyme
VSALGHTLDRVRHGVAARLFGEDQARNDGRCRRAPEWLVLCINNVCNLKCSMCDVGLGDTRTVFWANLIGNDPRNMTGELLDEILGQARSFRPRPKIGLAFTEPLIHPRILDFCRAIVGQGFYCEITTNGTALPHVAEDLVEIGVDEVVCSIDGPPAVHDRIRGRAGTFEKVYRGIECLNAAKARLGRRTPEVRISFTVTDANCGGILDFVQAVEPLHPAAIMVSHLNFISEGMAAVHNATYGDSLRVVRSNLGQIQPEQMPVQALFDELRRVKSYVADKGGTFPRLHITPDATHVSTLETFYRDHLTFVGGRGCSDPWKLLGIRTDGTVIPAHGRCYDFPVGNVLTETLPEIWNGPGLVGFRQTLNRAGGTLPACARCCGVIGKPAPAGSAAARGRPAAE